jgi:DNA-binding NtrC family response regulator
LNWALSFDRSQTTSKKGEKAMNKIPRPRLVFVDDDPDILLVLSDFFGSDFEVSSFETAAEAFARVASGAPVDLLLSDLDIGRTSGVDLVTSVRLLRPDLPVILLTGRPEAEQLKGVATWPALRIEGKPFSLIHLRRTIETLLGGGAISRDQVTG